MPTTMTPEQRLRRIARLHHQALAHTSFLTSFGPDFLYQLHRSILDCNLGFLLSFENDEVLYGFVLGSVDSSDLMSVIRRKPHRFLPRMFFCFLTKPSLIVKSFQILAYAKQPALAKLKAELVVIAVNPAYRSQGIGASLVKYLEAALREYNIGHYKVTVHGHMERANNFYRKQGFNFDEAFTLVGKSWNLYTKKVAAA